MASVRHVAPTAMAALVVFAYRRVSRVARPAALRRLLDRRCRQDRVSAVIRRIPPDAAGRTVYLQAAEQGRKSEVIESTIE